MNFLQSSFSEKKEHATSYKDFWAWFQKNEKDFFAVVKQGNNIEERFFNKLTPKLAAIKEGFYFLTGMYDEHTIELIFTADGVVKNIVFIEELVNVAPNIDGWKFTALKPALDIENVIIEMAGYTFNSEKLIFYATDFPNYPDEIDITVIHSDSTGNNISELTNGIYIFLDNYLGELDFATTIDNLTVTENGNPQGDPIPINKLKDFLVWRQKEFVEKYEATIYNSANDTYSLMQAQLEDGNLIIAVINTHLFNWNGKASHPWIAIIDIPYNGEDNDGMPIDATSELLTDVEDKILMELKDTDGYLYIGHQTADNKRTIYFACKEFRKPSKVFYNIQQYYQEKLAIEYDIYKDKYWQSLEKFNPE